MGAAELAGLIQAVHWALDGLIRKPVVPEPPGPTPAVAVRRSVRPDAIACLECGARFKILRRHLAADHGLAPEEYRARRGLPADYPMAAPDYAEARSRLAKQAGLGRKRAPRGAAVDASMMAPVAEAEPAPEVAPAPDEGTAPPPAERRGCRKAADPTPE